jgi:O-antigen/teichoic acid export membrane protein
MTCATSTGRRNILTNAMVNWLGFAVQMLVAFYLSPILVQSLGGERYGIWSLVESILAYLVLLDFGVGSSVVRYIARFEATHDHDQVNRVFNTSFCIFTLAGAAALLLAAAIAYLGLPFFTKIPPAMGPEARWLLILLGLNLGLGLPLKVFSCLLDGLGRYPAQIGIKTVGLIVRTALLLVVAASGGGLVPLALVITTCNILEYATMGLIAWRYFPQLRFSVALIDRSTLKLIRGYSVHAFVAMIAGRISFQTDAIVIGAFLMPEQITLFVIAARLVEYAKESFRAVTTGFMPAVSVLEAQGDDTGIRRMLVDGTRFGLWVVLPLQVGLMLLGKAFLSLWMKRVPEIAELSYPTLLILATPLALALPQVVAARILYGTGRLRWFARAVMIEAVANLLLSLILVQSYGIEGVALGTAIPNLLGNAALIVYICWTLDIPLASYLRKAFLLPSAVVLVPGGIWSAFLKWGEIDSWSSFVAFGFCGLAAHCLLAILAEFGPGKVTSFIKELAGRLGAKIAPASPEGPVSSLPRSISLR